MKRISILLFIFCCALLAANATANNSLNSTTDQTEVKDKSKQNFTFVYVVHDAETSVGKISNELRNYYKEASKGDRCIMYVPNMSSPLIAKLNIPGDTVDSKEAFDNIIAELNDKTSHNINIKEDIKNILRIVDENGMINPDGTLGYRSVEFDFYVTSLFWSRKYNDSFLAALYFALDIKNLKEKKFKVTMNVYYSANDKKFTYNKNMPYGIMNFNTINDYLIPLEY